MIEDRILICIASRFGYDPTGKHHIMKMLARKNRVLWVNYRGSRKPQASARDFGSAITTLGAALKGPQIVSENIVEMTPLIVPGASSNLLKSINRRLLVSQIKRALTKTPNTPVQLWSFAPDVDFLAGQFGEEKLIYYCVDEFAAFQDHDAEAIRAAENRLIQKADVLLTTSGNLFESRRHRHQNAHLVRHGVDFAHFSAAVDRSLPKPPELADLSGPIYGFFGLMSHWFDVDLLAAVARQKPAASFVLIGEAHADVTDLQRLPNVHLLGRRDYQKLPNYCASFDAALMPFRINEMTMNVNPIKLREYLAAGLPVISTALPEARAYQPHVFIADGADQFAEACDQSIEDASAHRRKQISQTVAHESWETVVERLSQIVSTSPHHTPSRTISAPSLSVSGAQ